MKFTDETKARIFAAVRAKFPNGRIGPCSLCGTLEWRLSEGYVSLALQKEPLMLTLGGTILPSVVITCKNCGNTHLLNLRALGLDDLLKPEPKEESPTTQLGAEVELKPEAG